jgi:hypothetical protein
LGMGGLNKIKTFVKKWKSCHFSLKGLWLQHLYSNWGIISRKI